MPATDAQTIHVVHVPLYLPPTTNALFRGKLRVRMRLEAECRELVAGYVAKAGIPKATGPRRVGVILTLAPRHKDRDPDNMDGARKCILDALVRCKALVDDRREWCEPLPVEARRAAEHATTIVLEELPAMPRPAAPRRRRRAIGPPGG